MKDQANGSRGVDALLPAEMAKRCEAAGVVKAARDAGTLLVLGILAGAFIAFGAIFMTVVATGTGDWAYGVGRLLAGLVFSLGLILVIVGGAELFTGDTLMVMAWAARRISLATLWRAWALVYLGNIAGALGTAALMLLAEHYLQGGGAVGKTALAIATAKAGLAPVPLFFLSVLCNALVCLAVWMSFAGRSVTDKVAVIVPPIAAFVAAGFEHSIANIYFLPYALGIKAAAPAAFWTAICATPENYAALTAGASLINIAISTLGNLLGGSLLVGAVYWFVYLRPRQAGAP